MTKFLIILLLNHLTFMEMTKLLFFKNSLRYNSTKKSNRQVLLYVVK